MRIDCPNCDASQEHDLPELGDQAVLLECEKCKKQFHASKDAILPVNESHSVTADDIGSVGLSEREGLKEEKEHIGEGGNDDVEMDEEDLLSELLGDSYTKEEDEKEGLGDIIESGETGETMEGEAGQHQSDRKGKNEAVAVEKDSNEPSPAQGTLVTEGIDEDMSSMDDLDNLLDDFLDEEGSEETDSSKKPIDVETVPAEDEGLEDEIDKFLMENPEDADASADIPETEPLEEENSVSEGTVENIKDEVVLEESPEENQVGQIDMKSEANLELSQGAEELTENIQEKAKSEEVSIEEVDKVRKEDTGNEESEGDLWDKALEEQNDLNETEREREEEAEELGSNGREEKAEGEEEEELSTEIEDILEEDHDGADEDVEEEEPRRKIGPIPLPATLFGKVLFGGTFLALAGTVAAIYFGVQTFMPPELAKYLPFPKQEAEVMEEIAPLPDVEDTTQTPAEEPTSMDNEADGATKSSDKTSELEKKPEIIKPAQEAKPASAGLEETETPQDVSNELEKVLRDTVTANMEDPDAVLLDPKETLVTLNAIMPVAYTVSDIKVLSFDVDVELDAQKSADLVREATPVFEKIMVKTVEAFLAGKMKKEKKFYNDILYVREKLQKELKVAFNKGLKGGRVKKVKFKEFLVQ